MKVHLLFDYKVTRRNSAIDLLADKFQDEVRSLSDGVYVQDFYYLASYVRLGLV